MTTAARTPTTDEILTLLRDEAALPDDGLARFDEVVRCVRGALRTTSAKAREWLQQACVDSPDLWLVYVRDRGVFHGALVPRTDGQPGLWIGSLLEAGFSTRTGWSHIGMGGAYLPRRGRARDAITSGSSSGNGERWVGSRAAIQHLLAQEDEDSAAATAVRRADAVVTGAAFDYRHPEARAMIAALLDAAGITPDGVQSRVHVSAVMTGDAERTAIDLGLHDHDIDRLIDLLRRLGIKPKEAT